MSKTVLMIAYHYPPCSESTGWQRTYFFAKYLPEFGWDPIVLTASRNIYSRTDPNWENRSQDDINPYRAFGLDSARHLSIKGRYIRFTAIPDRWVTWWPFAVLSGLRLIKRFKPKVIWSTFPIASAQLVARSLHRLTGLPWVADFRDPMVQDAYPPDRMIRNAWWKLESTIVTEAKRLVFTTPGSITTRDRFFPNVSDEKYCVIENGYDESTFNKLPEVKRCSESKRIYLHSGLLYPKERNPIPFFHALSKLNKTNEHLLKNVEIRLRACGYEAHYSEMTRKLGIDAIVRIHPAIPYKDALVEMCSADGLLLFQGNTCNYQIPAKLYEYLRTGRPILGLTEVGSDTANLLQNCPHSTVCPMEESDAIAVAMKRFLSVKPSTGNVDVATVEQYSRRNRTKQLATVLNACL